MRKGQFSEEQMIAILRKAGRRVAEAAKKNKVSSEPTSHATMPVVLAIASALIGLFRHPLDSPFKTRTHDA